MSENPMKETQEIDLREILDVLRRRLVLIIAATLLAGIVAAVFSFYYIAPVYQAKTTLLVKQEMTESSLINQLQLADVNLNMRLAQTYAEIISSRRVLSRVIDNLDLQTSVEGLQEALSVTQVKDTELIDLLIKGEDPSLTRDIANETAAVFIEEVEKIMKIETVNVLDEAVLPVHPISPNKTMNVLIAWSWASWPVSAVPSWLKPWTGPSRPPGRSKTIWASTWWGPSP